MAILAISEAEESVRRLVGTEVFLRGRALVQGEAVTAVSGSLGAGQLLGEVRASASGHSTMLRVEPPNADGQFGAVRSTCTCRSPGACDHAAAVLLVAVQRALPQRASSAPAPVAPSGPAPWERALLPAMRRSSAPADTTTSAQLALQFEISRGRTSAEPAPPARIAMRPVLPGRSTAWVRSGISWGDLGRQQWQLRNAGAKRQLRLLQELRLLATDPRSTYYGYGYDRENVLWLETVQTRRVWDLLCEATEAGLPLVQADRQGSPVVVCSAAAVPVLRVRRTGTGLELAARLEVDDRPVPGDGLLLLGRPPHGVAWWEETSSSSGATRCLWLAPVVSRIDEGLEALLEADPVAIPNSDERRFLTEYCPALRRRLALVAADDSVELPPLPLPCSPPRCAGSRATGCRSSGRGCTGSATWNTGRPCGRRTHQAMSGTARPRPPSCERWNRSSGPSRSSSRPVRRVAGSLPMPSWGTWQRFACSRPWSRR